MKGRWGRIALAVVLVWAAVPAGYSEQVTMALPQRLPRGIVSKWTGGPHGQLFVKEKAECKLSSSRLLTEFTIHLVLEPHPAGKYFTDKKRLSSYWRMVMSYGSGWFDGFRVVMRELDDGYEPILSIGKAGGAQSISNHVRLTPNAVSYLTIACDGTQVRFFLNGVCNQTCSLSTEILPPKAGLMVGNSGWGTTGQPMRLYAAAVWNRALEELEVAQMVPRDILGQERIRQMARELEKGQREGRWPDVSKDELARIVESSSCCENVRREAAVRMAETGIVSGRMVKPVVPREDDTFPSQPPTKALIAVAWAKAAAQKGDQGLSADIHSKMRTLPHMPNYLAEDAERQAEEVKGLPGALSARHPLPPAPTPGTVIVIATNGSDMAAGTPESPFRTVARACEEIGRIRKRGWPKGGVAVCVRGGRYWVQGTLKLEASSSGEPDAPVVWRPWRDETVIVDSGIPIRDFSRQLPKRAAAALPERVRGRVFCASVPVERVGREQPVFGAFLQSPHAYRELFCDGRPLQLARHPNEGFLSCADILDCSNRVFRTDILDAERWTPEFAPDLLAHGYWQNLWSDQALRATVLRDGIVRLSGPTNRWYSPHVLCVTYKTPPPYYFLNALPALDQAGEWFLDARNGMLYVLPPDDGTAITDHEWILSGQSWPQVLVRDVKHVRIEGFVFQNGIQHGVRFEKCSDVILAYCTIRNFGGNGLMATKVSDMRIYGNDLCTLGHGGMVVSGGRRETLTHANVEIENNRICFAARAQRTYAQGLLLSGCGMSARYNDFSDLPSSAIRFGGNDMEIDYNRFERLVTESDDQGAVESWYNVTYNGVKIRFNLFRDIGISNVNVRCGVGAVRFDDCISGIVVYGNRFYNSAHGHFGAVQINCGHNNVIDNNVFVGDERGLSSGSKGKRWSEMFDGDWFEDKKNGRLKWNMPLYLERYPDLRTLPLPRQNTHVTRNVFVGCEKLQTGCGKDVDWRCNWNFDQMPDLEDWSSRTVFRRLPKESELGAVRP